MENKVFFLCKADELSRMRSVQQEQGSKMSHMQLTIDEKDHELKTTHGDLVGAYIDFY